VEPEIERAWSPRRSIPGFIGGRLYATGGSRSALMWNKQDPTPIFPTPIFQQFGGLSKQPLEDVVVGGIEQCVHATLLLGKKPDPSRF